MPDPLPDPLPDPQPDPFADLRRTQDREYAREGISMVLALMDESGAGVDPADAARTEGADLAARLDAYRAVLAPTQRDGDLGVLVSVLMAVSYADVEGRPAS